MSALQHLHPTISSSDSTAGRLLDALTAQPADALLALIGAYRDDPRPDKIDVGVGVYRDPQGATPVMAAVKAAEQRLVSLQSTKSYLGPEGDVGFFEALKPIIFGAADLGDRVYGLQTPGGTGALRLAAELIGRARPGARIWVGGPTWPNHLPIIGAGRLQVMHYEHYDVAAQTLSFDKVIDALRQAEPGDVALLHGCCHNPTGADFTPDQWRVIAATLAERGVLPLIDLAYQGLGLGLDEDAQGLRIVLDAVGETLVAFSCDKNFGLYRERTGALYGVAASAASAGIIQSNLLALARANWSMPPDHGAAVVRTILTDATLTAEWRTELDAMRLRIVDIRRRLADADPALAPLAAQHGMFSTLPISPAQVAQLRETHAIYMPGSGRINIAGLAVETIPSFVAALATLR